MVIFSVLLSLSLPKLSLQSNAVNVMHVRLFTTKGLCNEHYLRLSYLLMVAPSPQEHHNLLEQDSEKSDQRLENLVYTTEHDPHHAHLPAGHKEKQCDKLCIRL